MAKNQATQATDEYFRVTDQVPGQLWYWAAVGSIIVSATLQLQGKRDLSLFIGQWPPTFIAFALFHKIIGSNEK
ncbi:MAG: hypothetical protein WKH64_15355 [Chloroflexia bacterium]